MSSKKPNYDRAALQSWLDLRCSQEGLPVPPRQALPRRLVRWMEMQWPSLSRLPEAQGISMGKYLAEPACFGVLIHPSVSIRGKDYKTDVIAPLEFEHKIGVKGFLKALENASLAADAGSATVKAALERLKTEAEKPESDISDAGLDLLFEEPIEFESPPGVSTFLGDCRTYRF
jgi:hypothetical protein